jgi:hypothetical protein
VAVEPRHISGEEIEEKTRQLIGKTILAARPVVFALPGPIANGIGLVVNFGVGSNLVIVPSPEPDEDNDPLPDWELFTPFHTYLRVGPGVSWAYLKADTTTPD